MGEQTCTETDTMRDINTKPEMEDTKNIGSIMTKEDVGKCFQMQKGFDPKIIYWTTDNYVVKVTDVWKVTDLTLSQDGTKIEFVELQGTKNPYNEITMYIENKSEKLIYLSRAFSKGQWVQIQKGYTAS